MFVLHHLLNIITIRICNRASLQILYTLLSKPSTDTDKKELEPSLHTRNLHMTAKKSIIVNHAPNETMPQIPNDGLWKLYGSNYNSFPTFPVISSIQSGNFYQTFIIVINNVVKSSSYNLIITFPSHYP